MLRSLFRLRCIGILGICTFSLVAVYIHNLPVGKTSLPLFLNTSNSLPPGLYHVTKVSDLRYGQILRMCLPSRLGQMAVKRGYLRQGNCPGGAAQIGKHLIALPGDTVQVTDERIRVFGHEEFNAPVYAQDRRGQGLSNAMGIHVLQSGECFLLSTHSPFSFDSRYYGPVPCGFPPYAMLTGHGFGAP